MERKCIIKTCTNSTQRKGNGDVMFHKFPTNPTRRENWNINIQTLANQMGTVPDRAIICSEHFDKSEYTDVVAGKKSLAKDAEPTIFGVAQSFSNVDKLSINGRSTAEEMFMDTIESECKPEPVLINFYLQEGDASQPRLMPVRINHIQPNETITQKSQPGMTSSAQSVPNAIHPPSKITLVRYPGDMADLSTMSRTQLENCVQICKRKVERQASDIKALRRQVRNKDRQIGALRSLVKGKK